MDQITLSTNLAVNPDTPYTQIDDDVVLMGVEDSKFYVTNGVGSVIWDLLKTKPMTLKAICEHVQERFDVTPEQCQSDVLTFVKDLFAQKMVHPV
jgi:hypothetical protein